MTREWLSGSVELVTDYTLTNAEGRAVSTLADIQFAIEGGYVHIAVPGLDHHQILSAPAIRRLTHQPPPQCPIDT
jgi:hypothetical protein